MTLGALALLAAIALPAGAVVDATAASDVRASFVGQEKAPPAQVYTLGLRPSVRAALEKDGAALDAQYSPQASVVTPSRDLFLLLHTAAVGGELPLSPRTTFRARANGAFGDLDPGAAQEQLFNNLGAVDTTRALSYASINVDAALALRVTPRFNVDLAANASASGSPFSARNVRGESTDGDGALRPVHQESIGPRFAHQLTRRDAVLLDTQLRSATVIGGGPFGDARYAGALTAAGYRRQLFTGVGLEARGGALTALVDLADRRGTSLIVLPLVDARAQAVLDLGGGSALEAETSVGLVPTTDPLGAVLDDRLDARLGVGWRIARDYAVRASLFAAMPVASVGGPSGAAAGTGAAATFAWAFVDQAALEVGAQAQSRVLSTDPKRPELAIDFSVSVGVTSTFTVWHSGARPRGSDNRPGRSVGQPRIGAPPATSAGPPEPEPLEEIVEEPPPEVFVPPPIAPPLDLDSTSTPSSGSGNDRRVTPQKKKKKTDPGDERDDKAAPTPPASRALEPAKETP